MVQKKNKIKSIFIQNFTKKGKKELIEKKINKLFFQLKKQLKTNPNNIFNQSLNNLKIRLHVDKKITVLSKIRQIKQGFNSLKFNTQLVGEIIENCSETKNSIKKNKTLIYNEAIKLKFNRKKKRK